MIDIAIKIVHVSRYSFTNDETGELIEGTKITFIDQQEHDTDDSFGRKVYTQILPYKEFESLKQKKLPLDCKAVYEQVSLDKKPKFKELKFN